MCDCKPRFLGGMLDGKSGGLSFNRTAGLFVILVCCTHIFLVGFKLMTPESLNHAQSIYVLLLTVLIGSTAASKITHNIRQK